MSIIIPIATLAVAILKLYLNQRKTKKQIELSKEYLKALSKLIESRLRDQKLEKDEFEWQNLKDTAKALWVLLGGSEEEE